MERKLYISDEAIEKFDLVEFDSVEVDDYVGIAGNDFVELENGILVTRDDMYNIYLSVKEDDESFNDIEDLRNSIFITSHEKVFNMKEICERASVPYQSYKNWKQRNYKGLSDYRLERIVEEMKKACE